MQVPWPPLNRMLDALRHRCSSAVQPAANLPGFAGACPPFYFSSGRRSSLPTPTLDKLPSATPFSQASEFHFAAAAISAGLPLSAVLVGHPLPPRAILPRQAHRNSRACLLVVLPPCVCGQPTDDLLPTASPTLTFCQHARAPPKPTGCLKAQPLPAARHSLSPAEESILQSEAPSYLIDPCRPLRTPRPHRYIDFLRYSSFTSIATDRTTCLVSVPFLHAPL